MEPSLRIGLFIVLGMLLQVALMFRPHSKKDAWTLGGVSLMSSIAFLPVGKNAWPYDLPYHIFTACGLFVFTFALWERDRLLPRIHESAIIVWNAIALYAIAALYGMQSTFMLCGSIAVALMTLILLLSWRMPFALKILSYAWFLTLVIFVSILQFHFGDFGIFFGDTVRIPDIVAVFDGMAFVFLGIHLTYLIILLPVPGKHQTLKDRIREWKEDSGAMVARFSDHQMNPLVAVGVLIGLALLFTLNTILQILQPMLLINLLLIVPSAFFQIKEMMWPHTEAQ